MALCDPAPRGLRFGHEQVYLRATSAAMAGLGPRCCRMLRVAGEAPICSCVMGQPPEIHETEIDGVRTFWTDAPAPLVGMLFFRVGHGDETLRTRGITHLVEHLALQEIGATAYGWNGAVARDHTMFTATGTAEEVADFLRRTCATLENLPAGRFETEVSVLSTEDSQRRYSNYDTLLSTYFGPNGPGLISNPEYALRWVTPAATRTWAESWFVRENAVLGLTGPPPEGLTLKLASGEYHPRTLPPAEYGFQPEAPTRIGTQEAGICVGTMARRSADLIVGMDVLRERLFDRLRRQLGLVYEVSVEYDVLADDAAFVFAGTDCEVPNNRRVNKEFVETFNHLLGKGPDEAEVDRTRTRVLKWVEADEASLARAVVFERARTAVLGDRYYDLDEARALYDAVTPATVHEALRSAFARSLAVTREGQSGFRERPYRSADPVDGKRYRNTGRIASLLRSKKPVATDTTTELIVGPQGVSGLANGRWVTLLNNNMAIADWHSDDEVTLVSRTGSWTRIEFKSWPRGRDLKRDILGHVPAQVHVPSTRGQALPAV